MNRKTTQLEKTYDENYQLREPFLHGIFVRVFRKHINLVAKRALSRAFERSQIDTFAYHNICGIVDRMLWPKRNDEPIHFVVQKSNIVMED